MGRQPPAAPGVNPPDSELVARVLASDDREAFAEIVRRHQSPVRRFLRNLTRGDEALADDLAQDTFIRAWKGLSRYGGQAGLGTWLMGIAHNLWRNARRKDRDRKSTRLNSSH